MNWKQAAKGAAKHIEELEDYNKRASADIKAYNACIDTMIAGGSPCPWCMEYNECQLEAKDNKGCSEWWLKDVTPEPVRYSFIGKPEEGAEDDSKGIHGASAEV